MAIFIWGGGVLFKKFVIQTFIDRAKKLSQITVRLLTKSEGAIRKMIYEIFLPIVHSSDLLPLQNIRLATVINFQDIQQWGARDPSSKQQ